MSAAFGGTQQGCRRAGDDRHDPGTHTFKLQCRDTGGVGNEAFADRKLWVAPPIGRSSGIAELQTRRGAQQRALRR